MERLTYKNYIEEYEVNFEKSSDKNWSIAESDTHIKVTGEPIEKLGELEDVLQKYGIENAKELDSILNSIKTNTFIDIQNKEILELENANLKSELAELKRKAIVPKYRQGQLVYILYNNIPSQVSIDKIIIKAKIESKFSQFNKIEIKYKVDYDTKHYNENDIFATQKEAEQRLAEIGGKDE